MRIPPQIADRLVANFEREARRARLHTGRLARLLTAIAKANAITFGRRVFLSPGAAAEIAADERRARALLAHELTHVRQYRRYGMAAFLGRYLGEYLRARLGGVSHGDAYRAISYEREAKGAESEPDST